MLVTLGTTEWQVDDEDELESILQTRDKTGGAEFWLSHSISPGCAALCIRVTRDISCIIYFPGENHPGFRCLGRNALDPDGTTKFVFDGCDPAWGEDEPNEFVIPFSTAVSIAKVFLSCDDLPSSAKWLEL